MRTKGGNLDSLLGFEFLKDQSSQELKRVSSYIGRWPLEYSNAMTESLRLHVEQMIAAPFPPRPAPYAMMPLELTAFPIILLGYSRVSVGSLTDGEGMQNRSQLSSLEQHIASFFSKLGREEVERHRSICRLLLSYLGTVSRKYREDLVRWRYRRMYDPMFQTMAWTVFSDVVLGVHNFGLLWHDDKFDGLIREVCDRQLLKEYEELFSWGKQRGLMDPYSSLVLAQARQTAKGQ